MAYKIDKNGMLIGDGLPDGVSVNMKSYQDAINQYQTDSKSTSMFPSMQGAGSKQLSDSVTKFRTGADNKIYAFVPEIDKFSVTKPGSSAFAMGKEAGIWVEASGISLDKSTKSGETDGNFSIRSEGGAPLAEFEGVVGRKSGYMRLASQQAQEADGVQLGNNSGTTTQQRRRRTLL